MKRITVLVFLLLFATQIMLHAQSELVICSQDSPQIIYDMKISPDQTYFIASGYSIEFRDIETGALLREPEQIGAPAQISFDFNSTGDKIAFMVYNDGGQHYITIRSTETFEEIKRLEHNNVEFSSYLAFSMDDSKIAASTITGNSVFVVFDYETGEVLKEFGLDYFPSLFGATISKMMFTTDGKYLAVNAFNYGNIPTIYLFDANTLELHKELLGYCVFEISADNQLIAAANAYEKDVDIDIIDMNTYEVIEKVPGDSDPIHTWDIEFNHDNSRVYYSNPRGYLLATFDLETKQKDDIFTVGSSRNFEFLNGDDSNLYINFGNALYNLHNPIFTSVQEPDGQEEYFNIQQDMTSGTIITYTGEYVQNPTINILDLEGRIIESSNYTSLNQSELIDFNFDVYPSGIYFINLITYENNITQKFMINQ